MTRTKAWDIHRSLSELYPAHSDRRHREPQEDLPAIEGKEVKGHRMDHAQGATRGLKTHSLSGKTNARFPSIVTDGEGGSAEPARATREQNS